MYNEWTITVIVHSLYSYFFVQYDAFILLHHTDNHTLLISHTITDTGSGSAGSCGTFGEYFVQWYDAFILLHHTDNHTLLILHTITDTGSGSAGSCGTFGE